MTSTDEPLPNDDSTTSKHATASRFTTAPKEEWTLLFQGAEAKVWKLSGTTTDATTGTTGEEEQSTTKDGRLITMICKERFSKSYRHEELDRRLTKSRCRSEGKILQKCNAKQLRVPQVYRIEPPLLYLEYLEGSTTVRSYLLSLSTDPDASNNTSSSSLPRLQSLARSIGHMIGKLHADVGVIHGDLTTSNMMVLNRTEDDDLEEALALIDFGLSKSTTSVEEQAVDLYVLERALQSTHPTLPTEFFETWVLGAYSEQVLMSLQQQVETTTTTTHPPPLKKKKQATKPAPSGSKQTALQRLEQVRQRGRKRECFG